MRALLVKALAALLPALLAASCGGAPERDAPVVAAPPPAPAVPPRAQPTGPVLNADGTCTGPVPTAAAAIQPGIGECELVRLKGRPPTDVLVGQGGTGQREVQVLYSEPGGRELYFFVDARLDRIVK